MAHALAIIFLVLGIACQFLLTTQKFTAGIQGIACVAVLLALSSYSGRRHRADEKRQRENLIIAILAASMLVVHAVQLPRNYEIQKKYDRRLENARAIEASQAEEQLQAE